MDAASSVISSLESETTALGEIQWVKLLPASPEAGQILEEANPN